MVEHDGEQAEVQVQQEISVLADSYWVHQEMFISEINY